MTFRNKYAQTNYDYSVLQRLICLSFGFHFTSTVDTITTTNNITLDLSSLKINTLDVSILF